jgi:hypothetical protein
MILANVRERLSPEDLSFVADLLAREDGMGRPEELLDEPALFELLRDAPGIASPSAPLFLYVAVRHNLRSVGIDDAELSDYLAALLLEFGMRDRACRIAPTDDATYNYVTDIVADLEADRGQRGLLLRAHLGNYSLWLSGVFPDRITARVARAGGPGLGYYEEMGARGFRLAADHALAREWSLSGLYTLAADQFERLRVGLNRLSDSVFFQNGSSPDRLMRQVGDEMRLFGETN